ncbi:hypothetical protein VTJ04DRAFT_10596 [Mycothermus thermophilus]|uniref:uncharacterized protein n=1 Tax=Humicola insolens TaxID=85995 RepID=UPI0037427AB0
MALLGLSLIFASVVLLCIRRPTWFTSLFSGPALPLIGPPPTDPSNPSRHSRRRSEDASGQEPESIPLVDIRLTDADATTIDSGSAPTRSTSPSEDGQSTPKATATSLGAGAPVPAFSLSPASSEPPTITTTPDTKQPQQPQPKPSASSLMPPPPRPPALRPTTTTASSSSLSPSTTTNLRNRSSGPIPARGPGCSTLAPPPTHTSALAGNPSASSNRIVLSPGHSPLDWARLSSSPTADLRGLPPGTPYLRVTPSMLKRMTGRKGKDAWTVLGGRVYNITPYLPFHPGGEPELLRAAGRDGTRLFGEVHPWVNYEGMLAACLVGVFVNEEEVKEEGEMEKQD